MPATRSDSLKRILRSTAAWAGRAWLVGFATTAAAAPAFEDSIAQRVLACSVCHGAQGRASNAGYLPRIAGKPAGYLYHQLVNFREGRRHYGPMTALIDPLDDAYLREIAGYFSALDLPYPPPTPATAAPGVLDRGRRLATEGDATRQVPACGACHGTALTGAAPAIPGLLGLPHDYLNAQLGAWREGKRRAQSPDCMAEVARRLSPEDLHAVTQWLAAQPVPDHAKPADAPARELPLACGGVADR